MRLYQLPVSLYSCKVRLGLALMQLSVEFVEPPGGSYRSAEFRAINPAGTIPTLVDGDFWLAESDAILAYLEGRAGGPRLTPADPRQAARAQMLSRWHDMRLEPALRRLFAQVAPATRDAVAVAAADELLAAAFALVETAADAEGPFVAGPAPTVADCGFGATLVWFEAMKGPLALASAPGERLRRAMAALGADPRLAMALAGYRDLVADWVAKKLAG